MELQKKSKKKQNGNFVFFFVPLDFFYYAIERKLLLLRILMQFTCLSPIFPLSIFIDSNTHTFSYLTMENYHKNLAKAMEDPKKATRVIEQLDRLRNTILASPLNVHFVGDPKRIVTTAEKQANNWSFLPNGDAAEKSPLEVFFSLLYYCQ